MSSARIYKGTKRKMEFSVQAPDDHQVLILPSDYYECCSTVAHQTSAYSCQMGRTHLLIFVQAGVVSPIELDGGPGPPVADD